MSPAYVLGSFAENSNGTKSDFDLAVVVDDKNISYEDVYKLLIDVPFPADLDLSLVNKSSSPIFLFQMTKKGKDYMREGKAKQLNSRLLF